MVYGNISFQMLQYIPRFFFATQMIQPGSHHAVFKTDMLKGYGNTVYMHITKIYAVAF